MSANARVCVRESERAHLPRFFGNLLQPRVKGEAEPLPGTLSESFSLSQLLQR